MSEIPSLETATSGSIRFNTDSRKLELYDGNAWFEIDSTSPEEQTGGTRGLTAAGYGETNQIEFFNIDTTGNGTDFGDLNNSVQQPGSASSRTRGCIAGGTGPVNLNVIDFITISSTGDAQDFGDLTQTGHGISMNMNDRTRGVFVGRTSGSNQNTIDYITLAQTGNAVDFGDMTSTSRNVGGGSSPTRAVFAKNKGDNVIEYITISTLGNSADFGDTTYSDGGLGTGGSNAIRCLFTRGSNGNDVCFVTIATLGNAIDFGDLSQSTTQLPVMCTSPTRAVRIGGQSPGYSNEMEYAQIMTTGNFIDFGDSNVTKSARAGLSNGHGGLG